MKRRCYWPKAFAQLALDEQQPITWRYIDGLTCEEIGGRRGCSARFPAPISKTGTRNQKLGAALASVSPDPKYVRYCDNRVLTASADDIGPIVRPRVCRDEIVTRSEKPEEPRSAIKEHHPLP